MLKVSRRKGSVQGRRPYKASTRGRSETHINPVDQGEIAGKVRLSLVCSSLSDALAEIAVANDL